MKRNFKRGVAKGKRVFLTDVRDDPWSTPYRHAESELIVKNDPLLPKMFVRFQELQAWLPKSNKVTLYERLLSAWMSGKLEETK